MGLLDSDVEEPKSKLRRYIVTGLLLALMLAGGVWYLFRFHAEKQTAEGFFQAVASGDMRTAYKIWQPIPTFTFEDFQGQFGPDGYYGPIKSFSMVLAQKPPRGGSGVIVVVDVSSMSPFPDAADPVARKTIKEVRLWVERKDQSLSFPP
ncbi:MAG: hypothetical protein HY046_04485 [Acidobacteria bacterium]|nr:hypothetical protein [Acidobacteriota bacterium]